MAIGEQLKCARNGCEELFVSKTHNQKYHDDECCRLATNAKIMEKYYARRAQRLGMVRYCSQCNETKLSRYNSSNICHACELESSIQRSKQLNTMLNDISWIAS